MKTGRTYVYTLAFRQGMKAANHIIGLGLNGDKIND